MLFSLLTVETFDLDAPRSWSFMILSNVLSASPDFDCSQATEFVSLTLAVLVPHAAKLTAIIAAHMNTDVNLNNLFLIII